MASSKSRISTASATRRAASSAASLTTLARSAPTMPGVRAAIVFNPTCGSSFTLRAWTLRMASRPCKSGRSTTTWRSNRPARNSAGSSTSGVLVAAIRITPFDESKPSISANSWLSVCSRSSLLISAPRPAERDLPMASSSSMKIMQGAFSLACSNRSRTRAAPTPTNISTNSDPDDVMIVRKLGTPDQPELAMGAIASGGVRVLNEELLKYYPIPYDVIESVAAREQKELERRERIYRGDRPALNVGGRTVILVDDG